MGLSLREVRRPVDLLEGQHVILSSGSKDRPAKRVDLKPFEETLNTLRDYDGPDEAFPAEQALQPRLHAKSPHLKAYFAYLDKELDHHDPCWCGGLCDQPTKAHEAGFRCRLCREKVTVYKGASSDVFKSKDVIGHFSESRCRRLQGEDLQLFLRAIAKADAQPKRDRSAAPKPESRSSSEVKSEKASEVVSEDEVDSDATESSYEGPPQPMIGVKHQPQIVKVES